MDYFAAATLLSKAAAANVPIQSLAKIPYWENMFPGAAGVYDGADFGGCTPGGATLPANFSPTATQAMYSSYACALHNETLPLIFADVPGELGLGPNPCFPACSKLGPYAYFNPQFASLYSWRGAGTSSYNALQVTIRRGMTHGLQWDFNYTYSKSIDIGSNAERVNMSMLTIRPTKSSTPGRRHSFAGYRTSIPPTSSIPIGFTSCPSDGESGLPALPAAG